MKMPQPVTLCRHDDGQRHSGILSMLFWPMQLATERVCLVWPVQNTEAAPKHFGWFGTFARGNKLWPVQNTAAGHKLCGRMGRYNQRQLIVNEGE